MKSQIHLSEHFTYRKLLRFTLPSIAMNVFASLYIIADGYFVANFAGKTEFAAVNLIMPFLNILGTIGYMFGVGGSALVAKTMGEGNHDRANRLFFLIVLASSCLGVLMMAAGFLFMRRIAAMLGAEGELLEYSVLYGRIFILALPAWIWVYEFQLFFVTAEKPGLGLAVTVCAGLCNVALDALFIIGFHWGLAGAAAASALTQIVGGVFPLVYKLSNGVALALVSLLLQLFGYKETPFLDEVTGEVVYSYVQSQTAQDAIRVIFCTLPIVIFFVSIICAFKANMGRDRFNAIKEELAKKK